MLTHQDDPKKKYWILLFVIVPIVVALIAIVPQLLNKETDAKSRSVSIESGDVNQSGDGNNLNNINGNVNINESTSE